VAGGGGGDKVAEKEVLVLDSSVAVKWFNIEPLREKALEISSRFLQGEIELEAPAPLYYEVGNTLRYNPRFGIEDVKAALGALEDTQILLHEFSGSLAMKAVELAYRCGITMYDAAYVALAETREATLYTVDGEVVAKVASEYVRHLSKF